MRKLKFKAWHKEKKKWLPVVKLEFDCDDIYGITTYESYLGVKSFRLVFVQIQDIDLVEYTGLKDENGVEIFEGDIVKITIVDSDDFTEDQVVVGEVAYGMHPKNNYRTEYPTSFTVFCKDFYHNEGLLFNRRHTLEVIGNIYENPELRIKNR